MNQTVRKVAERLRKRNPEIRLNVAYTPPNRSGASLASPPDRACALAAPSVFATSTFVTCSIAVGQQV